MGSGLVVVVQEVEDLGSGGAGGVGDGSVEFFLDSTVGSFDGSIVAGGGNGDEGLLDAIGF